MSDSANRERMGAMQARLRGWSAGIAPEGWNAAGSGRPRCMAGPVVRNMISYLAAGICLECARIV